MSVLIDSHTGPPPVITDDRTGHRTVLLGVMMGLRTNIESPSNRAAYTKIAEAIALLEAAEEFVKPTGA